MIPAKVLGENFSLVPFPRVSLGGLRPRRQEEQQPLEAGRSLEGTGCAPVGVPDQAPPALFLV